MNYPSVQNTKERVTPYTGIGKMGGAGFYHKVELCDGFDTSEEAHLEDRTLTVGI